MGEQLTEYQRLAIREIVRETLDATQNDRRREVEEIIYKVLKVVEEKQRENMEEAIEFHHLQCQNKRVTAIVAVGTSIITATLVALLTRYVF